VLGRTGGFLHFVFGGLDEHVFEGGSGGDHGEDVFVFDALGLDDAGAVVVVEGLLEDAGDIGRAADVEAFDAVGFAELDEVRVAEQIDAAFAVVEEQLLPLADHAEVAVVEDDDLDGQLVNGGGGQFKQGHLEAAVAGDGGDDFVWAGELSADGGGETEAHGAGTAGAEPVVAGVIFVELGGPHLVLTHVGGDDGFAFGELVELVDDLLHAQAALFFVAEGVFLFVAVEVGEPVFGGEFFDERQEVAESGFGVAFDGDVHLNHFVELGGVDVDVDEFGVAAEHGGFADDAVVKAGADVEDEVGLADGFVGVGGAVHAEHAEGEGVGFWEDAFAKEGGGDGAAEGFGEHEQLLVGPRDHGALTGEDDGAFGLGDEFGGFFDAGLVDFEGFLWVVTGEVHGVIEGAGEGGLAFVFWDVDEDGSRAAGGGDVVSFLGDAREVVGFLDEEVMLNDGLGDVEDVGFLEGVFTKHPGNGLAAEDDHGDGVHLSGHQAGDGVASAGAGSDQNDGGFAGGASVAVGHVDSALFVADQDELHVGLDGFERVKDGEGSSTGVTKDIFDAEVGEGFDEGLSAVHGGVSHKRGN
jgi:hypothetical protein